MITFLTEVNKNMIDRQINKAVALNVVGKKYLLRKTAGTNITMRVGDFWALKEASFDIQQGGVFGIIGRNGAGKTTLLNIIAGTLSPTQGSVFAKGKVLGLFNLGVGFQDELSGKENIFLNGALIGATRKELDHKLNSIIDFSELGEFINMPLGSYSQGMRLRLGFSIIANIDFDILIIDEVLAVGDALFQSKCFQRLMEFKRLGKTLVITSQNTDLIERLCDNVALIEHGHLIFVGNAYEAINRYRELLNKERFYVGPTQEVTGFIGNTKKWADDISNWGERIGTKEAIIESVELINKFGKKCERIKTRDPLKIKVGFHARNTIKNVHFGIAIFRNDGVYCYGPNTAFDGHNIPAIKTGKGCFILKYKELLLAPGEYRLSVAIWDKNETLAFDYHNGYYKLIIEGDNHKRSELLNMPCRVSPVNYLNRLIMLRRKNKFLSDLSIFNDKRGERIETEGINIDSVRFLDSHGEEKSVFMTNESVKFMINIRNPNLSRKNSYLWLGIYRDDGICCQSIAALLEKKKNFSIFFPKLRLLPGEYRISLGVWDMSTHNFLVYLNALRSFRMIFNQLDHGTVYLDHNWGWKLP